MRRVQALVHPRQFIAVSVISVAIALATQSGFTGRVASHALALTPIQQKYASLGGSSSFLGPPVGTELPGPSGGMYQDFRFGSIYWSPTTGAHEVHGAIGVKYRVLRRSAGVLGYPTTDEFAAVRGGRQSDFQFGRIYWSPGSGAHESHGPISAQYHKNGGPRGSLGFPISDVYPGQNRPNTAYQEFQSGSMYWNGEFNFVTWEERCPKWACRDRAAARTCRPDQLRFRTKPNDRLTDIDRITGFFTTPLKRTFSGLGWRSLGCIIHNGTGYPVRRPQISTDGFITQDIHLASYETYGHVWRTPGLYLRLEVHWQPAKGQFRRVPVYTGGSGRTLFRFGGLLVTDVPHKFTELHPSHEFEIVSSSH